jgi:HK97 family phage major capsid protein
MKKLLSLLTAEAIRLALGFPEGAVVKNDEAAIEQLQDELLDLRDQANNIQARADAEKRDMTEDEQTEVSKIFARFESVEADIARRAQLAAVNARLSTPNPRQTQPNPEPVQTQAPAAAARTQPTPRASVPAQPRSADSGKWGFRNEGEYFKAVMFASAKGGQMDPRLIANAPTTYGQEGVGSDGGFAVPPDFRTQIVAKVMGEESLLSRTDQMTTSSNAITIPRDETTPWQSTGGIQAYWESEAGQKSQSKPALTELTVKANKLVALVPLTDELMEDAPSMAQYVGRKAPEKMDFAINNAILNGSGVGQPLGILNSAGTVVVAAESGQAADTIRHLNINAMWGRLAASAKRNAIWVMNSDVESQLGLLSFRDGTSTPVPIYIPPGGVSGSPYGTLMGRPVITSEACPAIGDQGDIMVGDFSQYLSVTKGAGVRQDMSIHLWFDYDVTAFRFVLRVGGQPWWNSPIARTGAQSSRGFFATLAAR